MKKTLKLIMKTGVLVWAMPVVAAAATIDSLVQSVKATLNNIIALLFVLVTIYFIWGIVQYITSAGDQEKLKKGKQHMIWGIIGMAVMAAAWSIVRIIMDYFGASGGGPQVPLPTF
jgi:uncharacterized membrane protein (GlpM family)